MQVALAPLLSIGLGLGVPGLIYSILISNMVAVTTGLYLASRHFDAKIDLQAALSIMSSSILAFLVILPIEMSRFNDLVSLTLEVFIFAAVYLTAVPLLRGLGPEDLEILGSALGGLGRFKSLVLPILAYERFIMRHSGRRG